MHLINRFYLNGNPAHLDSGCALQNGVAECCHALSIILHAQWWYSGNPMEVEPIPQPQQLLGIWLLEFLWFQGPPQCSIGKVNENADMWRSLPGNTNFTLLNSHWPQIWKLIQSQNLAFLFWIKYGRFKILIHFLHLCSI